MRYGETAGKVVSFSCIQQANIHGLYLQQNTPARFWVPSGTWGKALPLYRGAPGAEPVQSRVDSMPLLLAGQQLVS